MDLLNRLSIRARFRLMIGMVTVSLVVTAGVGVLADQADRQSTTRLFDQTGTALTDAGSLRETTVQLRRLEASMMAAAANPLEVERFGKEWQEALKATQGLIERIGKAPSADDKIRSMTAQQLKLLGEYAAVIQPLSVQLKGA